MSRLLHLSRVIVMVLISVAGLGCNVAGWISVVDPSPTPNRLGLIAVETTGPPVRPADITATATSNPSGSPENMATVFALTGTPASTPEAGTPVSSPHLPASATPPSSSTLTPSPSPSPFPSLSAPHPLDINPLTGLKVEDPDVWSRRPLHVRIGNDPQARPQINLSQADIVYEELVEWWITRFTAVYYANTPEFVAPVRSARLINIQLAQQYDAALVSSGASDPVRDLLEEAPIIDLDSFYHEDPYFFRPGETWQRRLAVNTMAVHEYLEKNHWQKAVDLRGFTFDIDPPAGQSATRIFIDYPSPDSKVLWLYNAELGQYERYEANQPMIDFVTEESIKADNVVIYFAEHRRTDIIEDSTGATSVEIEITGEGEAWICRDGIVIKGRWRTDGSQPPEFIDRIGRPIPLHPGQTWIQVVPLDYQIGLN